MHLIHTNNFTVSVNIDWIEKDGQYVTSHEDCIGNAGRIKGAGIAQTVIIKLNRQREFSGIFFAERGDFKI